MSAQRGDVQQQQQPPPRAGSAAPVDSSSLHMLVYSYLLHTNCGRTAQAFARTSGLATSGRLQSSDAPPYLSAVASAVDEDVGADAAQPPPAKAKGVEKTPPLHGAARPGARTPGVVSGPAPRDGFADPAVLDARGAERASELIDHHIEYLRIRT
ncbi:hypothetical protein IWQ57_005834, partial [Coemansia nantahalensis]